ncbi:hypothetical protein [Streptomyces umbrinus]|uniref:hypothetical protein n=1 Tax=Streptomyces umbrinus TaxID=67370 RepID=UPI0033F44721
MLRRLGPRSGRPGRRTVGALATIVVAAGAFAVIAAAHTVPTPITTAARIQAGVAVGAVAFTCRTAGKALGGRGRCPVLSAGAAHGRASVPGRAGTEHYGETGPTPGTLAGLAAAVLTGFGLLQRAYADGPPETTTANVTITDPMAAVVIGVALLGEAPALTGVITLAPRPARRSRARRGLPARQSRARLSLRLPGRRRTAVAADTSVGRDVAAHWYRGTTGPPKSRPGSQ